MTLCICGQPPHTPSPTVVSDETYRVGGVALPVEVKHRYRLPEMRADGHGHKTTSTMHILRECDACGEVTYVRKATKDHEKKCRMTPGCTGRYTRRAGDDDDRTQAA